METFTWVMAVLFTLSALAKIDCLYSGEVSQRTPGTIAFDLVFDICLLVWAAVLLSS